MYNKPIQKDIVKSIVNDLKKKNKDGSYKYSYKELSEKYSVSKSFISDVSIINNLERGLTKFSNIKNLLEDIKSVLNGNYKYTLEEIKSKYNISHKTIRIIMRKYNIKRNKNYYNNKKIE